MNKEWLLILGANSNIAIATAHRFAEDGLSIYLASRNVIELNKEASDLQIRYRVNVKVKYFDALDFKSHSNFYKDLSPKPKGVILAFGVLEDQKKQQTEFELAKNSLDTNFMGAISVLELVAADFEQRKSGFIVGISSVAGDRGRASNYFYGSSKAGLSAYLEGLRHRLYKSNVHVLIVKPGFVATKMTANMALPRALTADPNQVASAIYKGVAKKKNTLYIKPIWRYIMMAIRLIPESIFKRLNL
ncbi:SDR family oxidoreductase [Candidatus Pseudothioglobus singularis]|jgi:decaprenylphospho-beta-D-erythro-pentofuranosid-2-ulose 2-reductase|nr:SDR family oxidoreductase [Candidatus Pseudothioglobus singularis]